MRGSRFAIAYELSPMGRTLSRRGAWRRGLALLPPLAAAALLAGCGGGSGGSSASRPVTTAPASSARLSVPSSINLTSPALAPGRPVPRGFTCDGQDDTPPLRWSGVPAGTAELALLFEDMDARGETGDPFLHWSVFGIPASATQVPGAAKRGTNDFHQLDYNGPCPPQNDPAHHYVFTLYALRAPLDLPAGSPPADVRAAIARAASAQGRLAVTYTRAGG
jgi:Raf kinase inhibitor-like YbhB/YbcL family protein